MLTSFNTLVVTIFVVTQNLAASQDYLTAVKTGSTLPRTLAHSVAAYDGNDTIYIFGGYCESCAPSYMSEEILRYTISTDTIQVAARFPKGLCYGAVSPGVNGTYYFFGGYDEFEQSRGIYKFSASIGSVSQIGFLPDGVIQTASLSSFETHTSYIFSGGLVATTMLEFNSETETITRVIPLPVEYDQMLSFWDGSEGHGYIFGSRRPTPGQEPGILFTPGGNGEIDTLVNITMNEFEYPTRGVVDTERRIGYGIGGFVPYDSVLKFDMDTGEVQYVPVLFHPGANGTEFWGAGAAYVDGLDRIYFFGGVSYGQEPSSFNDGIWYIDVAPVMNNPI